MHSKKLIVPSIVFGLVVMAPLAFAQDPNPGVLPPHSHSYGMTYAEWSTLWWRWAESFPVATNPILDPTGAGCALGQTGPVWFLAGTFGGPATRTCTVPAGKAILLPLVNILNDYPCPDPTFQPGPGQSLEDFLTEGAEFFIDHVTELEAEVDGVALQDLFDYRATSRLFSFTGDTSLQQIDACITGSPQAGVSDGYWIMLRPLSVGNHTIHFRGKEVFPGPSVFETDVTYNLTVAPRNP